MERIINIDTDITAKSFKAALNRFFAKRKQLEYWKETFEYMYENDVDFFSDNRLADGTENKAWTYALHLDCFDTDHYYFAIIERA